MGSWVVRLTGFAFAVTGSTLLVVFALTASRQLAVAGTGAERVPMMLSCAVEVAAVIVGVAVLRYGFRMAARSCLRRRRLAAAQARAHQRREAQGADLPHLRTTYTIPTVEADAQTLVQHAQQAHEEATARDDLEAALPPPFVV